MTIKIWWSLIRINEPLATDNQPKEKWKQNILYDAMA